MAHLRIGIISRDKNGNDADPQMKHPSRAISPPGKAKNFLGNVLSRIRRTLALTLTTTKPYGEPTGKGGVRFPLGTAVYFSK